MDVADKPNDPSVTRQAERARLRNTASSVAVQLALVLAYLAAAAVIPGKGGEKVAAFVFLLVGIIVGCGVAYLLFRFLIHGQLEAHREEVRADAESLASTTSAHMDTALATMITRTGGMVIPDQALLSLEAASKNLRRVVIASADGPDEFASNPKDRGSALGFGEVVLKNLKAGVAYEWWSLDSRKASAARTDAQAFLLGFDELAQIHSVSSDEWALSPFSFDTIFLAFKDGRTDGFMQLPSEDKSDVHWIRLPAEVRKDFQGVIDRWRLAD